MRRARVLVGGSPVGFFVETDDRHYFLEYDGTGRASVSLTMPAEGRRYEFDKFPPFFDGLLPEGPQLEALLKQAKLDRNDYFGQLVTVGKDLVGAVTVEAVDE